MTRHLRNIQSLAHKINFFFEDVGYGDGCMSMSNYVMLFHSLVRSKYIFYNNIPDWDWRSTTDLYVWTDSADPEAGEAGEQV